ncbi:replication protein A1-like protein, partial [Trifolium medium]|nr:replication protein A1-like protein [Trifolium medium]
MANSGMYVRKTKVAEICGGKIDFQLRVRVINLWTTPDRANSTEEGALYMIFLDEEVFKVKAIEIPKNHFDFMPFQEILAKTSEDQLLGVMGISSSFYGSKLLLNAQIPEVSDYIERMNDANVELTQVVSQMTGPVVLSFVDDLLQTPKMTIEDLIESTEKCCGSVLARACEIDTDSGWFYQACTKCSSRINFIGGQLYCEKCKMPRTAIP